MKHAFSLVELSIVLVILGLLTGGILTGQNLIRAAELRSVTTELQKHQTAIYTFRDKYFALPGDMTNATDFWSNAAPERPEANVQRPLPMSVQARKLVMVMVMARLAALEVGTMNPPDHGSS